jgi:redox-sensitive bicupin YhaK (pirin superfamily)
MFQLRKSADRGRTRLDWLDSRHSFSFANYFDQDFVNFRSLRVLNEDWIAPGAGFGPHAHRDMEILTVPLAGRLAHRDDHGHEGELHAGKLQWMRAGRGIIHSEMNASEDEPVHLLQIWIEPRERRPEADYLDRAFEFEAGRATLIASGDEERGAFSLAQDARIAYARIDAGRELSVPLLHDRHGWVQWLDGEGRVGEIEASAGDGVMTWEERELSLFSAGGADALVFDLS